MYELWSLAGAVISIVPHIAEGLLSQEVVIAVTVEVDESVPFSDIEALIGIIKATHQAQLAATSIRAADDLVGELLDVTA